MKRALLVTAFVLGSAGAAAAGPYLGFAVGPVPSIDNTVPAGGHLEFNGGGRSGRVLGGYRFVTLPFIGTISVEGNITGYTLRGTDNADYGGRLATLTGKYNYPLGGGMEVFGRLGLNHTWIASHKDGDITREGNGYTFGVGAEYRFKLPMAQASAWVDYSFNTADLADTNYTRGYTARMWMLGFTFGI